MGNNPQANGTMISPQVTFQNTTIFKNHETILLEDIGGCPYTPPLPPSDRTSSSVGFIRTTNEKGMLLWTDATNTKLCKTSYDSPVFRADEDDFEVVLFKKIR